MTTKLTLHEQAANFHVALSALSAIAQRCPDPQHVAESALSVINFSGVKPGEGSNNNNEPVTSGLSAERHRPILPTKTP
jgi:hypothetical protein